MPRTHCGLIGESMAGRTLRLLSLAQTLAFFRFNVSLELTRSHLQMEAGVRGLTSLYIPQHLVHAPKSTQRRVPLKPQRYIRHDSAARPTGGQM